MVSYYRAFAPKSEAVKYMDYRATLTHAAGEPGPCNCASQRTRPRERLWYTSRIAMHASRHARIAMHASRHPRIAMHASRHPRIAMHVSPYAMRTHHHVRMPCNVATCKVATCMCNAIVARVMLHVQRSHVRVHPSQRGYKFFLHRVT